MLCSKVSTSWDRTLKTLYPANSAWEALLYKLGQFHVDIQLTAAHKMSPQYECKHPHGKDLQISLTIIFYLVTQLRLHDTIVCWEFGIIPVLAEIKVFLVWPWVESPFHMM